MDENEMIVCEFLRKIAPSREWEYLGEVEHYWIAELCDELNRQLKDENAKLRELAERAWKTAERLCQAFDGPCRADDVTAYKPCPMGERDEECVYGQLQRELREFGMEVD